MLKKITVGVSALAMTAFAGSAMASPVTVDIDVVVQNIAELNVLTGAASMTIDDSSDTFMGQPSSTGSSFDAADLAVIQLNTNFDVSSINISYPKTNGIGGDHTLGLSGWFGQAIGSVSGNTLAVWPQACVLPGATGGCVGGGGGMIGNDSSSPVSSIVRTNTGGGAFGNGTHFIGLGVSTNWDRVPAAGPEVFAAPDTYSIQLTATIFP